MYLHVPTFFYPNVAVRPSVIEGSRYNIIEIKDGLLRVTTVAPRTATAECWYETLLYQP